MPDYDANLSRQVVSVEKRGLFPPPSNCVAEAPRPSFSTSCVTIHVTIFESLQTSYSADPTASPAPHSVCPHSQAIDGRLPTLSQ